MNDPDNGMVSREVTVVNRRGLHARAAARVAGLCETLPCEITVSANGVSATARSIMGLMLLAAGPGDILRIEASGAEAETSVEALASLVRCGFEEDCDGAGPEPA